MNKWLIGWFIFYGVVGLAFEMTQVYHSGYVAGLSAALVYAHVVRK